VGKEQIDHQLRRCVRRIIGCTLGCPLKHTEEFWLTPHTLSKRSAADQCHDCNVGSIAESSASTVPTFDSDAEIFYGGSFAERARTPKVETLTVGTVTQQQYHETDECPKRLVMCPKNCLEWVVAELMDKHLTEQCTKRPAKPILCRNGCGEKFGGQVETLIQAEDERLQHEQEECFLRVVRCTWQFDDGRVCAAQMRANEREEHRDYHLTLQGMMTYSIPGTYLYKVPKKLTRLKVQLWGGGGGSGFFQGRQGGSGGGGAYVEVSMPRYALPTVPHYYRGGDFELCVVAGYHRGGAVQRARTGGRLRRGRRHVRHGAADRGHPRAAPAHGPAPGQGDPPGQGREDGARRR
jgi:hypothetical protein